jgi:hypothetical protein
MQLPYNQLGTTLQQRCADLANRYGSHTRCTAYDFATPHWFLRGQK